MRWSSVRRSMFGQGLQQRGDVDDRRLEHLAAGKREQLSRQFGAAPGGPGGGADDLLHQGIASVGRCIFEHLEVARDHREQVAEIVRHAAGQLADALESLGVVERVFAALALHHRGEHARQRLQEADFVVAEAFQRARANGERSDGAAPVRQRHREFAHQAGLDVVRRNLKTLLLRVVAQEHGLAVRHHVAGGRSGLVGDPVADGFLGQQSHAGDDPEVRPSGSSNRILACSTSRASATMVGTRSISFFESRASTACRPNWAKHSA